MKPVQISWHHSLTPRIREVYGPIIEELAHVLPRWCVELVVLYSEDVDCPAQMTTHDEYRRCHLTFGKSALDQCGKDVERRILTHELMHAYTIPCYRRAMDAVKECCDEKVYNVVFDVCTKFMEAETCDLEELVSRLLS